MCCCANFPEKTHSSPSFTGKTKRSKQEISFKLLTPYTCSIVHILNVIVLFYDNFLKAYSSCQAMNCMNCQRWDKWFHFWFNSEALEGQREKVEVMSTGSSGKASLKRWTMYKKQSQLFFFQQGIQLSHAFLNGSNLTTCLISSQRSNPVLRS